MTITVFHVEVIEGSIQFSSEKTTFCPLPFDDCFVVLDLSDLHFAAIVVIVWECDVEVFCDRLDFHRLEICH